MTEEEFNAKLEEYRQRAFYQKRYENRVQYWAIVDLVNDMYKDYNELSDEKFIEKYNWIERLLFKKPPEPVEDKGDNKLNNIERYRNSRLLNYNTEEIYYLGPTIAYYVLNLVKETERIKKEGKRREKLLNKIRETNGKMLDEIGNVINEMEDLSENYYNYDEETKIEKLTINLCNLIVIVNNLLGNSITTSNLLDEDNQRLDKIEKIVASIAPVITHITTKTDESYAKALDLEEEVSKLKSDVIDVRTEAGIAANDASFAISMLR